MRPLTARSIRHVPLAGILAIGTILRLWGIRFGLPHTMARPDEEVLLAMALGFFSGDFNPHFFEWPSLAFYALHGALRLTYMAGYMAGTFRDTGEFVAWVTQDPAWVHLALRLVSAGCGVATLLLVHGLTARLFDRLTAHLAAFFLAVAFLAVRDSHFGVLDVPLTFLIVSCVALLASTYGEARPWRRFAMAGAVAGLATSFKYNAAGLVVVALVAAALHAGGAGHRKRDALTGIGMFVLMWGVCGLAGTPYALLDYPAFRLGLEAQFTRLSGGHGVRVPNAWLHHLEFSLRYGLGVPLLAAGLAGIPAVVLAGWRRAALLLTFPLTYFAVIGSGQTAFVRYAQPLVPFLCITAAVAVTHLARSVVRPGMMAPAAAVAAVALSIPSFLHVVAFNRLLTERDTRLLAADWLRPRVAGGASVYESGYGYAKPHPAWRRGECGCVLLAFDENRDRFVRGGRDVPDADWVVVARSPLRVYTPVSPPLDARLRRDYELVEQFVATREPESQSWFDRHDAFFLPYTRFDKRVRPGPDLYIYQRRER